MRKMFRQLTTAGVAASIALGVAACSPAPAPSPSNAAPHAAASSPALKHIDPIAMEGTLEKLATNMAVPGAMVELRTPQGEFEVAVGVARRDGKKSPTAATNVRIGSATRPMTSALVMLLAQHGQLQLDDPVADYVPGVPNGDSMTIADLLAMRSGLNNYTESPVFVAEFEADPAKVWTPRELLDIAFGEPPVAAPGTRFHDSDTDYELLGLVAEKAGGRPLAAQFEDQLFRPLGLKDTFLPADDDGALPAPAARGYMSGGGVFAPGDTPRDTLAPTDYTDRNPSYAPAARGVVSTSDDMATWMKALVAGKVLDDTYQQKWLDSLQPAGPGGDEYGYGIAHKRFGPNVEMYYQNGEAPGYDTFVGYDPAHDVTLAVWTNSTFAPDGTLTADAMAAAVLSQVYTDLSIAH